MRLEPVPANGCNTNSPLNSSFFGGQYTERSASARVTAASGPRLHSEWGSVKRAEGGRREGGNGEIE